MGQGVAGGSTALRVKTRWLWALVCFVTGLIATGCAARIERPKAVHGELDLSNYRLAESPPLPIEGEWEFYWREELTPADIAAGKARPSGFIDTGSWSARPWPDASSPRTATPPIAAAPPAQGTPLVGLRVGCHPLGVHHLRGW